MTDLRWTQDNRKASTVALIGAFADGMNEAADEWLTDANTNVPFDEGTLEASGRVTPASSARLEAAVSYDTPYAVRQHEDPSLHHPNGRMAGWLRTAGQTGSARYVGIIRSTVARRIG